MDRREPPAPRATYRVQLTPEFDLDAAASLAGYLARLGVSHLYCSPYLQAAPGSRHGYDVVDPSRVNVELGGEAAQRRLGCALREQGLGQVLDVVPNHMAIGHRANRWWWDVLKHGSGSRYAAFFDVSWNPSERKVRDTILLPILKDHYGRVLEAGELRLEKDPEGPGLVVRYHEQELPVDPATVEPALGTADLDQAVAVAGKDVDRLDGLLERQHYRLARWQTAGFELDYRRFFDVNSLAALRMESPEVFAATHARILEWLGTGVLDGVRVDHPDGLRDPKGYFDRLREAAPGAWIVAEKILAPGEPLPGDWAVAGTTGYDFLNLALGLQVDREAEAAFTGTYASFTGETQPYEELAVEKKRLVMRELLASDLNRLVEPFTGVCERNRRYRDFTRRELLECLREAIACLGVYRTYARPGRPGSLSGADREELRRALARAAERRGDLDPDLFDFLGRILRLEVAGADAAELVWRFQQTSGAVAAKGVEDTAFYVYNRFAALNEVGGAPSRFGLEPEAFHAWCQEAAARRPAGMLTTGTHDTKRSEDVRARLAALSEIPGAWHEAVRRWSELNEHYRSGDPRLPNRNAEYLLYQTLVGTWPIEAARAQAYMEKATREAKTHTSWLNPDAAYDDRLRLFTAAVLDDEMFRSDLGAFVEPLVEAGRVNSLAAKLLCLTAPGVPDLYQGGELWDLSLVDPDNRRQVDFQLRSRLLADLDAQPPRERARSAWGRRAEGLPKLLVVAEALRLRARRPELFAGAAYEPLAVAGERARHALGFCRGGGAVTLVPRLTLRMAGDWRDTRVRLPLGRWRDRFTGAERQAGPVPLAELLAEFPVALLERLP